MGDLISSLPKSIDGWKKKEIRSRILRRKRTIYINEKKGSHIEIVPPNPLFRQYVFTASIMEEPPDVVWNVISPEPKSLLPDLKSAVKLADIWHKNKIKTLMFFGASKNLIKKVTKEIHKEKLKKVI
jgi:hypothetical protein